MRPGITITLLLGVASVGNAMAWREWQRARQATAHPATRPAMANLATTFAEREDSLSSWADLTVENDPFRLSNEKPDAQVGGAASRARPVGPDPMMRQPLPALFVKAIVGGPPWQAVLSGVPGENQDVVVQVGRAYGGLTIRRVTADSVIVQGADTTWRLTMRPGGGVP